MSSSPGKRLKKKAANFLRKGMLITTFGAAAGCSTVPRDYLDKELATRQPDVYADTSNVVDFEKKIPSMAKDFSLMSRLPLTGRPVYDLLKNPDNQIRSAMYYTDDTSASTINYYVDNLVVVSSHASTTVTLHEYFHASQNIDKASLRTYSLTQKDAMISVLLTEAAAIAYELAARQESENHRLQFRDTNYRTYSDHEENKSAFRSAYNQAWSQHPELDTRTREAKALEAGGKAVVRRLLAGKSATWKETYQSLTVKHISKNLHAFKNDAAKITPQYTELRNEVYARTGHVSSEINFIPDEYLGPQAAEHIDSTLKTMGLREISQPLAAAPTPDCTSGQCKLPILKQ